ncbi:hypothetical protein GPJ56_001112 [Histomonas meleagridis]|uniref:uncharacterized protein n=1 Tax=Histomonas meleagridis TaxID=135588 RepID=UPI0035599EAB|nr:hypothetical protein GPJ56_001112 [Histomonas meleagridis]KAH0798472.1 hypothetical protein GO595_008742 [Histomonas meleagridis]
MTQQQKEIKNLTNQRTRLISLIQSTYSLACRSESSLTDYSRENQQLKSKINKMRTKSGSTFTLKDLKVNFHNKTLQKQWSELLTSFRYVDLQKVEQLLQFADKTIEEQNSEYAKLQNEFALFKSETQKAQQIQNNTNEIFIQIISELKKLILKEYQINEKSFGTLNESFIHLMTEKSLDFKIIEESIDIKSHPLYLFSYENRRQILEKLIYHDERSDAFISSLLIINNYLNQQLNRCLNSLSKKEEFMDLVHSFGCTKLEEVPTKIKTIIKKYEKTKASNIELTEALTESQQQSITFNNHEIDYNNKIKQLELTNNDLKKQNDTLKVEVKFLEDKRKAQNVKEIQNLQNNIKEKCNKIQQLETQIQQNNIQNSLQMKQMEKSFNTKIQVLQDSYTKCKEHENYVIQKYKKRIKHLLKEYKNELQKQSNEFLIKENSNDETVQKMKEKIIQLEKVSKQIADALSVSEKRNQALNDANTQLKVAVEIAERKVQTYNEMIGRERTAAHNEAVAKVLAVETRLHAEREKEKAKMRGEKEELMQYVVEQVGAFYGIDVGDIDEDEFKNLMIRIRLDLQNRCL